ncbi:peptide chain release factor N(5)-glutamine methyltransferase [Comamonas sp. B21-038]|jgi:release factor glutamine methyltransferase|uniref:peptide chain release factor N(5)-glutamine methyltransferase n=1 Tax=Comamonas sp. B21-038 TaxID=2918299 RepID=UPI001EFAB0C1|nr:peptide chain release factor N(5)-glutamine methyltransferase [Comamonas sp. B21-038]ULR89531.1 peptide chain release factor N(5)-glutamine methyltransferase [Comamonas sp. B21-038]
MNASTPNTPVTVSQALAQAAALGIARIDAQMLLLHLCGQPTHARAWLITHDSDSLSSAQTAQWQQWLQRRADGEPVAYLTGHKGFYGLDLAVDARVLDPRPDTETLVDWALELLPDAAPGQPALRLADLGTGSGAIALALQHARPAAEVWAVDASSDALAVAQANAERLQLPLRLAHSHWLSALQGPFDAIITNPPYIRDDDPHMPALRHEPRQALTSGADGLDDIRHIIDAAPRYLRDGGWLLIEHGWDQADGVRALLAQRGFAQVQSRNDLAGIERASGGQWASMK